MLGDLSAAYDFIAAGVPGMVMNYSVGMSAGGAADTLAPELKAIRPGPTSHLNYDKADIWSLGSMLIQLCVPTSTEIMDACIRGIVAAQPQNRLSCYDAYKRVAAMVMVPSRLLQCWCTTSSPPYVPRFSLPDVKEYTPTSLIDVRPGDDIGGEHSSVFAGTCVINGQKQQVAIKFMPPFQANGNDKGVRNKQLLVNTCMIVALCIVPYCT